MPISAPEMVVAISFSAASARPTLPPPTRRRGSSQNIAELRALDDARVVMAMIAERQHDQEQIFDVLPIQRHRLPGDDVSAARAADKCPVDDQVCSTTASASVAIEKNCSPQPQRQIAHAEADNAGDEAADPMRTGSQRIYFCDHHGR